MKYAASTPPITPAIATTSTASSQPSPMACALRLTTANAQSAAAARLTARITKYTHSGKRTTSQPKAPQPSLMYTSNAGHRGVWRSVMNGRRGRNICHVYERKVVGSSTTRLIVPPTLAPPIPPATTAVGPSSADTTAARIARITASAPPSAT